MADETATQFRTLFRRYTTGVAVIGVAGAEGPAGMTVNSLTAVSLDPPLLLFCAANRSATAGRIAATRAFSANILTAGQQDASTHYAGGAVSQASWSWRESDGVPWLDGANASFLCSLHAEHLGGDHRIVVGRVFRMFGPELAVTPLLYHGGQYARLPYPPASQGAQPGIDELWWTG